LIIVNGAVNSFREPAANILKYFHQHHELWEGDREALVSEFINPPPDSDEDPPSLSDLKLSCKNGISRIWQNIRDFQFFGENLKTLKNNISSFSKILRILRCSRSFPNFDIFEKLSKFCFNYAI